MAGKTGKSSVLDIRLADGIEIWPISRLIPYDSNPRTHSEEQIAQIADSIREFGFTNPILVASDGGVLAGHGRLRAARRLKLAEVPVVLLDHLSEDQRRAYIIADNKLAENAGWDLKLLHDEIEALSLADFDLGITGFSERELEEIDADFESPEEGATDEDEAAPVPATAEEVVSRPGDVWSLGPHTLVVGDMLDKNVRALLTKQGRASLIVTDPPYNVGYRGSTDDQMEIVNDEEVSRAEYLAFLEKMAMGFAELMQPAASIYLFYPGYAYHEEYLQALSAADIEIRQMLIWVKSHFRLNWGRYKYAHEPILYCHKKGEKDAWYGDAGQQTVWSEKKPHANRDHPTMKPVELIERAIVNSSRRGDYVIDPFGGSGSTLIAAQRMGRSCGLIEIDPFYADVVIRRWQGYTRDQARLQNGDLFSTVERLRYAGMEPDQKNLPAPSGTKRASNSQKKKSTTPEPAPQR